MKTEVVCALVLSLSLWSLSFAAAGASEDLCKSINQESGYVAYLVDKDGKRSEGPIDYGVWTDDGQSESVVIETKYKLLLAPSRARISNNSCSEYGCLRLTRRSSICRGADTYSIGVTLVFRRQNTKYYHYSDDFEFPLLRIDDPKEMHEPTLQYRFSPRIKGKVITPEGR